MESIQSYLHNTEMPQVTFTQKKQQRLKGNVYAPLEERTKKIQEKLKKRLETLDQRITTEKLDDSKNKIKLWFARHLKERSSTAKTDLVFFNEGRNPAKPSHRVQALRKHLKESFYQSLFTAKAEESR